MFKRGHNDVNFQSKRFEKNNGMCFSSGNTIFSKNRSLLNTNPQVWQNDGLPSQICNKCSAKLHISFQFKKQCEKSDAKLRQYLSTVAQEQSQQQQQHVDHHQIQQVTQPQQLNKLDEIDLNQQINQNNCVYIECAPLLEIQQEQKFEPVFVPASQPQQPSLTQINYNVQSQNHLQLNNYNLQGVSQVQVYNSTYNMPLQPMQPANILHNQVIAPQMQMQQQQLPPLQPVMQQQVSQLVEDDKDKGKKNGKVKRDGKVNDTKQCPTCNKIFANSTKLSRHMKTHSTDMPYKCKVCNKAFSHSGNYKIHLRMHTDERPFRCTVCDKGCRQAQDLEKHMRTHTGAILTRVIKNTVWYTIFRRETPQM